MRVRVQFRYRADTGEVEVFRVDDAGGTPVGTDHDRRHECAALDVARVVDRDPLIEEIDERAGPVDRRAAAPATDPEATGQARTEQIRE